VARSFDVDVSSGVTLKRRLVVVLAVAVTAFASGAVAPATEPVAFAPAAEAKPCSSGWRHAVLPTGHKCLRAGQFCAARYDGIYHRYGYHCHTGRLVGR
jgi:hypothetical protein